MLKPSFYNMFSKVCLFVLQFSSTKNFTKFHQNQDQVCEISFPACVRKTGLSIIISSVRGVRSIFVFSLCNIYVGINVCGDIVVWSGLLYLMESHPSMLLYQEFLEKYVIEKGGQYSSLWVMAHFIWPFCT